MNARFLPWLAFVLSACRAEPKAAPPAAPSVPVPASSPRESAGDFLDRMDGRAPVPLIPMMAHHQKQNMRDHLSAVQEIISASARHDFAAVATAAQRIGYTEKMGQMCEHMGMGAPGFSEAALEFHRSADEIVDAARKHDGERVLLALGRTLTHCTSCHSRYKQRVVDEATWSALTQGDPQHGHHGVE